MMIKKMIAMAVCISFLGTGCGEKSLDKQLVGTWVLEGETANTSVEFVFYEDGSYKRSKTRYGETSLQVSGDYKVVSEEEIELTSDSSGLGSDMGHIAGIHGFELEEDVLTIKGGGGKGVYRKSK